MLVVLLRRGIVELTATIILSLFFYFFLAFLPAGPTPADNKGIGGKRRGGNHHHRSGSFLICCCFWFENERDATISVSCLPLSIVMRRGTFSLTLVVSRLLLNVDEMHLCSCGHWELVVRILFLGNLQQIYNL